MQKCSLQVPTEGNLQILCTLADVTKGNGYQRYKPLTRLCIVIFIFDNNNDKLLYYYKYISVSI